MNEQKSVYPHIQGKSINETRFIAIEYVRD